MQRLWPCGKTRGMVGALGRIFTSMTRVLQISDTHLSPTRQHFEPNWAPLAAWVRAQSPALVVHTGDASLNGADLDDDMRHAAAAIAALPAPVLSVPGNHDVGEPHHPHQPVNDERLARWRRHFGPDWWHRDVEAWRLVGLDSMIFGAGLPAEAEQLAWLARVLEGAGDRRIAVFTHRPLWIEDAAEGDRGYWAVTPAQRRALLGLFDSHDVALVATGHLHRWRDVTLAGRRHVWGSASSFLVGPKCAPPLPGETWLGAVAYDFQGRDVTVAHAPVPGLREMWIDDVIDEVYPSPAAG
jgi:3',5'-cyclic AMP phosphodiesterase CpdA